MLKQKCRAVSSPTAPTLLSRTASALVRSHAQVAPTVARYPDTSGRAQIPCEALRRVGSHFGELYPVDIRGGVLAPGREPFRIPKRKLGRLPAIRKTFRRCSSRSSAIST